MSIRNTIPTPIRSNAAHRFKQGCWFERHIQRRPGVIGMKPTSRHILGETGSQTGIKEKMPNKSPQPTGISTTNSNQQRSQSRRRLGSTLGRLNRKKASGGGGVTRGGPIRRLLALRSATEQRNGIEHDGEFARGAGIRWPVRGLNQKYYSRFSPQ